MIRLMHAKLHRAKITACNVDYMGSLTIDPLWMKEVGILPLEEVQVVNVTNANRFVTYAIPGTPGAGEIEPNGACAHLCSEGDIVIIYAMESVPRHQVVDGGHVARVLVFDGDGTTSLLRQTVNTDGSEFSFDSHDVAQEGLATV
ncbi:aspartate 1-decarboxylase [Luteibacter sahnii]|uniref:aspartate 1-decarboxylase n=1 Tax=Luteibacter sahnii TaxID=3021977 RepID=UPI002A6A4E30|nr:aspartate 1-decarboxylase [Luteibacter sp. PPL193]MDY1548720.1 aspartate 1-decarboxylase [Luteibacter sp. PPL193]